MMDIQVIYFFYNKSFYEIHKTPIIEANSATEFICILITK